MEDKNPTEKKTIEERLEEISAILHRMDKRDRLRMIGSTIHSLIAIIPLLLLLWSTWYLYMHGTEFIEMITKQTIQQMTGFGGSATADPSRLQQLLDQLQGVQVR